MEIKGKGIGGLVFGVVLIVVVLAVAYVLFTHGGVGPTVPDQTNDEMEVAPS